MTLISTQGRKGETQIVQPKREKKGLGRLAQNRDISYVDLELRKMQIQKCSRCSLAPVPLVKTMKYENFRNWCLHSSMVLQLTISVSIDTRSRLRNRTDFALPTLR